jgi:hypothetical protein
MKNLINIQERKKTIQNPKELEIVIKCQTLSQKLSPKPKKSQKSLFFLKKNLKILEIFLFSPN